MEIESLIRPFIEARDEFDNVITTGDLGIFNVYVKAAADVFDWTDEGAADPNYASTPYNPSIQVNTVVWDADVQKYVAFYKSTAW